MLKTALLDTDIVSLFLRGDSNVVEHANHYLRIHSTLSFSINTYYEILSWLYRRDARKQLRTFLELATKCNIVQIDPDTVDCSARLYAELHSGGIPLDDIDLLIAGVALSND